MTAYVPSVPSYGQVPMREAVLICPGGAYVGLNEREMEAVALQFVANGYCAFVLNYSIGAGMALLPTPLYDIGKGIAAIRSHSKQWAIDPEKIYLCGFSSGAYGAALYGSVWHEKWLSQETGIPNEILKPSGVILGYPILDMKAFENQVNQTLPEQVVVVEMMFTALFGTPNPSEAQLSQWQVLDKVSEKTAPTWLWSLSEDVLVHKTTLENYQAELMNNQVNCKFSEHFGDTHGSGLYFGNDRVKRALWFDQMAEWLSSQDKKEKRC